MPKILAQVIMFVLYLIVGLISPLFAQDDNEIFLLVEDQPRPTVGMDGFYKYIGQNLEYPKQARRLGVQGEVFIQFVVDKDGSITDVKVLKGIGAGCDEAALRVIKESPKWIPGKQKGEPVKVRMSIPISFKLTSGKKKG